ncbi:MAG: hypothetical protein JWM52_204 [Candidatus Saccharibacteria bacterium]|nr:hypothetical protein [Candidatus Saccharibacteria bacterium]
MPPLHMQIPDGQDGWKTIADITKDMSPPSISDNHEKGRDVYMFGVDGEHNQGFIVRSVSGVDLANSAFRTIHAMRGFEEVAQLNPGESHELTVKTDASPEPRHIRFLYEEDET